MKPDIGIALTSVAASPLAIVVVRAGHSVTADELRQFLEPQFAKWWLPDTVEFIEQIPRTSAGKFRKSELRERFRERYAQLDAAGQTV